MARYLHNRSAEFLRHQHHYQRGLFALATLENAALRTLHLCNISQVILVALDPTQRAAAGTTQPSGEQTALRLQLGLRTRRGVEDGEIYFLVGIREEVKISAVRELLSRKNFSALKRGEHHGSHRSLQQFENSAVSGQHVQRTSHLPFSMNGFGYGADTQRGNQKRHSDDQHHPSPLLETKPVHNLIKEDRPWIWVGVLTTGAAVDFLAAKRVACSGYHTAQARMKREKRRDFWRTSATTDARKLKNQPN